MTGKGRPAAHDAFPPAGFALSAPCQNRSNISSGPDSLYRVSLFTFAVSEPIKETGE
jgi:hypothetical protein